jgi:hypothetical protein
MRRRGIFQEAYAMELKPDYDMITSALPGDARDNLDALMDFFGSLKLAPRWYAANAMNIKYKGKIILRFTVVESCVMLYFTVAGVGDLEDVLAAQDEETRRFFFENLRVCTGCNPKHDRGRQMTILGRTVHVCAEPELKFVNPTRDQVNKLMGLTELRRENILRQ